MGEEMNAGFLPPVEMTRRCHPERTWGILVLAPPRSKRLSRTSRNQKGLSFRPKGEILVFLPWSRKSRFLSAFGMTSFYILLKEHILQHVVFAW